MHVKEIWRYPVKSMADESLDRVHIDKLGLADDRKVLVATQTAVCLPPELTTSC